MAACVRCARPPLQTPCTPANCRLVSIASCSKNALLYAAYVFIIAAAVAVALGVALNCPSLASGSLFLLLLMMVLAWAAVWAATTGLKVGSDG